MATTTDPKPEIVPEPTQPAPPVAGTEQKPTSAQKSPPVMPDPGKRPDQSGVHV